MTLMEKPPVDVGTPIYDQLFTEMWPLPTDDPFTRGSSEGTPPRTGSEQ